MSSNADDRLDNLMSSMSLADIHGGPKLDALVDSLREKLNVSLSDTHMRELASRMVHMRLQSQLNVGEASTQSLGRNNLYSKSTSPSSPLLTPGFYDAAPPTDSSRGRSPLSRREKQNSLPGSGDSKTRSSTPVRNFFRIKSPPIEQNSDRPQYLQRSNSSFRILTSKWKKGHQERPLNINNRMEDEKKEHDPFIIPTTPKRNQSPASASPQLNLFAEKTVEIQPVQPLLHTQQKQQQQQQPATPNGSKRRGASPDVRRGSSPVKNNTRASSPPVSLNRPASPWRPGLQDSDVDAVSKQSPARRDSFTLPTRSHSATLENLLVHPRSKPTNDEDDSQPAIPKHATRHRKSLSAPLDLNDIDLENSDFMSPPVQTELPPVDQGDAKSDGITPLRSTTTNSLDAATTGRQQAKSRARIAATPTFDVPNQIPPVFAQPMFPPPAYAGITASAQPIAQQQIPHSTASQPNMTTIHNPVNFSMGMGGTSTKPATGRRRLVPKRNFRFPSQTDLHADKKHETDVAHAASSTPQQQQRPNSPVLSPMDCEPILESTTTLPFRPVTFSLGVPSQSKLTHRPRPRSGFANRPPTSPVTSKSTPPVSPPKPTPPVDTTLEQVKRLRDEARAFYAGRDYQSSISVYTSAIHLLRHVGAHETNDMLAVLLSNRAACFMMVNAFEAAASDCQDALPHVSDASAAAGSFSNDCGPPLLAKLLVRLAKAHLRLGDCAASVTAFDNAIHEATLATTVCDRLLPANQIQHAKGLLSSLLTEATLGKSEANRLRGLFEMIQKCLAQSTQQNANGTNFAETLGHVNMALNTASGSVKLMETKLQLLEGMKRWREIAISCERLAASRISLDGVFVGELELKSPIPGVAPARNLTAEVFTDVTDDTDIKLSSKAAMEAVLRLPHPLVSYYLRALRLQERYPAAESALLALEEYIERGTLGCDSKTLKSRYPFLSKELSKLQRTRKGRERGDELFRLNDFDMAAAQYGKCLAIDGEDDSRSVAGYAGGRLHAVLHCNRAACFMALRRFHEGLEECTAALRIHSRYMKALLRRSRCFMRLNRFEEAIQEYSRWLELVNEYKKKPIGASSFVPPCIFDGPSDVSDIDIATVKRELDEVQKAKRRNEAAAREEVKARAERQKFHENVHGGNNPWGARSNSSAHDRRDHWYGQHQHDFRRWDSFGRSRPGSTSNTSSGAGTDSSSSWGHTRSKPSGTSGRKDDSDSQSQSNVGSPGSDLTVDHYTVLGCRQDATEDDIKKSYRKLALKFHPDKNHEEGSANTFRRIKLAYETLSDLQTRKQYDHELRSSQRKY
jgi:tetratricopeptide (TPR) repeat protein